MIEQIVDALERDIRRWKSPEHLWVVGIMPLAGKHSRHHFPPGSVPFHSQKRFWIEPVSKGIVHQVRRDGQKLGIVGMLKPIPLQRAEVVGVAEFLPQSLEHFPVLPLTRTPDCTSEVAPKIGGHSIVVEQRIVDIEKKDHPARRDLSRPLP